MQELTFLLISSMIHFNILQLWCYEEKFFLIHGKVLTVIMYKCETSSLAAAVGKLKDSQSLGKISFFTITVKRPCKRKMSEIV